MAVASPRNSLVSPSVIMAGIFGLILAVSVFLPWLTPKAGINEAFTSSSGMNVSSLLGLTGIASGLMAVAVAFIPSGGIKKALHILIGLAVVGVLALMIFNSTLPLLSSVVRKYVGMGFGLYLYAFSGVALVFVGLMEKSRVYHRPERWASPQPAPQYAQQTWTPPPAAPQYPPQYAQPAYNPPPAPFPATPAYSRHCDNCGQPLKPGVSFCASCGQPVSVVNHPQPPPAPSVQPACPNYGRACSANAAFCPVCGTSVRR